MMCISPVRIFPARRRRSGVINMSLDPSVITDGLLVPCGKCIACRIAKRREWAMRCMHELSSYGEAMFVTLTYSDDYLSSNATLVKRDLQLFFKRLRKALGDRKIRYFACGEYGDKTQRPHYHAIIFGLVNNEDDRCLVRSSWLYCDWLLLESSGGKPFGFAEPDSVRYVAQYVDKKLSGPMAEEVYNDREPVFVLRSLGLGRDYCDTHSDALSDCGYITVNGVPQGLPRYYVDRLGIDPEVAGLFARERDADVNEELCGVHATTDEIYRSGNKRLIVDLERNKRDRLSQHGRNLRAKSELTDRRL